MTEHLQSNPLVWLEVAKEEAGIETSATGASNSRIEEYHKAVSQVPWNDKVPWCSSFLNWCIACCGIPGTGSAIAKSWLNWGTPLSSAKIGCIVVLWRKHPNSPSGHVGIFLREDSEHVYLWGGNQLARVGEHFYSKSMVLAYRWPTEIEHR